MKHQTGDPYAPEVGQQYEYHEGAFRALVTVLENQSDRHDARWLVRIDKVLRPALADTTTFTYAYARDGGYRMGEFWPVGHGSPYMAPEERARRGLP